jgi:predicted transcriptional regulator
MQELTKAEEQVMQCLWKLKKGFLKDIVEQFPEPRPAYTTISTVVRVLVKKGFIGYNSYGKVNEYFPKLGKNEYAKKQLKGTVRDYFEGSVTSFASFFTNDKEMNVDELEEIKAIIEGEIRKRKGKK